MTLYPNPGKLPTRPAPQPGQRILLTVYGYPPYKDVHFSIRNPRHPAYECFVRLREAATKAMKGRKWYDGPVRVDLELHAPEKGRDLLQYVGGIMDTLDGSHGVYFTYLPIVYQDDCQVCLGEWRSVKSPSPHYVVRIQFLSERPERGKEAT